VIAIVWKGLDSLWLFAVGQIRSGHPWPHSSQEPSDRIPYS